MNISRIIYYAFSFIIGAPSLALGQSSSIQRDRISSTDQIVFINQRDEVTVFQRPLNLKGPVVLKLPERAIAVSGSFAVTVDGKLWHWTKSCGWLSEFESICTYDAPQIMPDVENVASVQYVSGTTYIIKNDGSLWGWRKPRPGLEAQSADIFGNPWKSKAENLVGNNSDFVRVPIPEPVVQVSSGSSSIALSASGSVWVWGGNYYHEFGKSNERVEGPIPGLFRLTELSSVRRVKSGITHNYIVLDDGRAIIMGGCPMSDSKFGKSSENRRFLESSQKIINIYQNIFGTQDMVFAVGEDMSISKILIDDESFYYSGGASCTEFTGSIMEPRVDLPNLPTPQRPVSELAVDSDVGASFGVVALTDDGSLLSISPHPPVGNWKLVKTGNR